MVDTHVVPDARKQRPRPSAARPSRGAAVSRRTIATRTKAAMVCANVQIAFTVGGAEPVPNVNASTPQATSVVVKTLDRPQVRAANSVASHRDGNGAYVGRNGLRSVAT